LTETKRRQYTAEFKKEAVELVTRENYTVAQAARSLGISRSMLDRWRRQYRERGQDAFPGTGHQSTEVEELRRLREGNRRLKLEKEILKKWRLLKSHGMVSSMSRSGNCLDNAVAERFFRTLKSECLVNWHEMPAEEVKHDIVDYIEMFYNSERLHSYTGYLSRNDYEKLAVTLV